jgi:hypothetical protein
MALGPLCAAVNCILRRLHSHVIVWNLIQAHEEFDASHLTLPCHAKALS